MIPFQHCITTLQHIILFNDDERRIGDGLILFSSQTKIYTIWFPSSIQSFFFLFYFVFGLFFGGFCENLQAITRRFWEESRGLYKGGKGHHCIVIIFIISASFITPQEEEHGFYTMGKANKGTGRNVLIYYCFFLLYPLVVGARTRNQQETNQAFFILLEMYLFSSS